MKDSINVPFYYPLIPLAIGFIFFIICTFLFANGYKAKVKRSKHASYISTATILFVVRMIAVAMIAVYLRADLAQTNVMLSTIIIPVIYLSNIFFYSIFYYFFSKAKIEEKNVD